MSLPSPPSIASSPPAVAIVSLPGPPITLSAESAPLKSSLPAPRSTCSAPSGSIPSVSLRLVTWSLPPAMLTCTPPPPSGQRVESKIVRVQPGPASSELISTWPSPVIDSTIVSLRSSPLT